MAAIPVLPKEKPCTQCFKPIAAPASAETDHNRIHFVWKCTTCDFQFQTTAIYDLLQRQWMES
jgi:hypothetical protein